MADLSVDCPNCGEQNDVPVDATEDAFVCKSCGQESLIDDAISAESAQQPDYLLDEIIGNCKIIKKVGEGGFGSVYKATDQTLQRTVALKVMLPSLTTNQEFVHKFIREAVTAAQLNHSNIVSIHNVGRDEKRGLHYLIMEFVEGVTLTDIVDEKGVLGLDESIGLMVQAADALATAHERSIIHRDIKPENLMVNARGVLKITDFGLAKSLTTNTNTTKIMGTPFYMSPEQFEGKSVDGRTDIYSLGVTFYYLLTKGRPYEGENTVQIIYSILTQKPKPLSTYNPDLPEAIWEVILKMIAKDPEERYQTLRDTIKDLKKFKEKAPSDRSLCPGCGAQNPKTRKFCRGCGGALIIRCPACGSQEPTGTEECSACGADIGRLVKIKQAMESAGKFKALGDMRRAAESYQKVLDLEPDHAAAASELAQLGDVLQEMDRVSTEVEELTQTGDIEAAMDRIDELLLRYPTAGDLRDRRDQLQEGISARRVNRLVEEAEAEVEKGDIPRALELLDQGLREDPSREDVRARRGDLGRQVAELATSRQRAAQALAAGQYEEAFALASEVLNAVPGDAAMEEIRRKAHSFVESVDTFVTRGKDRLAEGKLGDALGDFEAALSVRPGDKQLIELMTSTREKLNEHRDRLSRCRRLMAERKYSEAVELLETALQTIPEDRETGSMLQQCKRMEEEAEKTKAATDALKEGKRLSEEGLYSSALEQYEKALELDPRNEEARVGREAVEHRARQERDIRELADEHLQDGRYDAAIDALERLRATVPAKSAEIDAEIAQARRRDTEVEKHLDDAEKALYRKEYIVAADSAKKVLEVAPRHPRAVAVRRDADKAIIAIDRFLGECDRLTMSELFDEALDSLARAKERGCTQDQYRERRAVCQAGRAALLKEDATRSIKSNDFEAAIAVYEQVLESNASDADALDGLKQAERRVTILTTEPMALRLGAAAIVTMSLFLVSTTATALTRATAGEIASAETAEMKAARMASVARLERLILGDAYALVDTGLGSPDDLDKARGIFLREQKKSGEKFAQDPQVVTGLGFLEAVAAADALESDPAAQLEELAKAERMLGDVQARRTVRQGIVDGRKAAAIETWVEPFFDLMTRDAGAALELIESIRSHPVAGKSEQADTLARYTDFVDSLQGADALLAAAAFPAAAEQIAGAKQDAAESFAGDENAQTATSARYDRIRAAWLTDLKSLRTKAGDDAAFYETFIKGLAQYEVLLGLTPEQVLGDLTK